MSVFSPFPGNHPVTYFTIRGKLSQNMIGVSRFFIVVPVAIDAIAALAVKSSPGMTLITIKGFMNACQGKSRIPLMIPGIGFDGFPAKGRVTLVAVNAQL